MLGFTRIAAHDVPSIVHREKIDIWLTSFGGVATNTLSYYLEAKGFNVRTPAWHYSLCHYPHPVDIPGIKAIYLYGDPLLAFASQRRRGPNFFYANYLKLVNKKYGIYSNSKMLRAMVNQYFSWTRCDLSMPLLSLSVDELFDPSSKRLADFLGIEDSGLPEVHPRRSVPMSLDTLADPCIRPSIHEILKHL